MVFKIGRIKKTARGAYKSMDTGRYVPRSIVKILIDKAREAGYRGAASKGKYERAATTYMERYGYTREQAIRKVIKNLKGFKAWQRRKKAGKKAPEYFEWESP